MLSLLVTVSVAFVNFSDILVWGYSICYHLFWCFISLWLLLSLCRNILITLSLCNKFIRYLCYSLGLYHNFCLLNYLTNHCELYYCFYIFLVVFKCFCRYNMTEHRKTVDYLGIFLFCAIICTASSEIDSDSFRGELIFGS